MLVNNAGGFWATRHLTADGLEHTDPGVARTAFGAEDPMRTMMLFARPFMKTPEQAAATPIYLASSPEVEGVTGRYFANRRPKKSSKSTCDTAAAARLWGLSAGLAGLPATI